MLGTNLRPMQQTKDSNQTFYTQIPWYNSPEEIHQAVQGPLVRQSEERPAFSSSGEKNGNNAIFFRVVRFNSDKRLWRVPTNYFKTCS